MQGELFILFSTADTDLAEDALLCFSDTTASGLFNSASESALKETSLEFEGSLLRFFDSCREENNVAVEFPEGLLAIIVAHVMQEAAEEPYGVKGNDDGAMIIPNEYRF